MIGTGRIHVYYGDGKGKTTAAMGLALRAAGSGLDVLMFQFLKDNSSSERVILEQIPNVTCLPGKDRVKFVSKMNADEKARLKHYSKYKLLIIDEIGYLPIDKEDAKLFFQLIDKRYTLNPISANKARSSFQ